MHANGFVSLSITIITKARNNPKGKDINGYKMNCPVKKVGYRIVYITGHMIPYL